MRSFKTRLAVRAVAVCGSAALGAASVAFAQEPAQREALTLEHAITLARENHPSVGVARAGEDVAAAALRQAKSAWWPQLATQANVTRFQEPMLVSPIHGFTEDQFQRIEFANTLIQGNVSLGWTILDGARVNRIRGARAGAEGATAGRAAAEMGLAARAAVAYLDVLTARGVLDAIERRTNSLAAERHRVEQLLAEGQAAQVELLRVDAALAEAEAQLVAMQTRLDLTERSLARLVDLTPAETRVGRLHPVRLADGVALDDRAVLVRRALAGNPELEAVLQAVDVAEAGHRVAKSAWIPNLRLGGGYQMFSSDNAIDGDGRTTAEWNLGVALSYPLFTGGNRSGEVSRASAEVDRAKEELRLEELRIREDVDRALNAAMETGALVDALDRAVEHQTEVVRIEQLSLEEGAGTQTDYLRAEADLARARSLLVEAQHAEIAARVQLARVVGELTPEWLDRNLESVR
jgi:multidrug efflux system outer membrane protein